MQQQATLTLISVSTDGSPLEGSEDVVVKRLEDVETQVKVTVSPAA